MTAAVPKRVEHALSLGGDTAPGHRFLVYFAGWWTEAEERALRLDPAESKLQVAQRSLTTRPQDRTAAMDQRNAKKEIELSRSRLMRQRDFESRDNQLSSRDLDAIAASDLRALGGGVLSALRDRQERFADAVGIRAWRRPAVLTAPLTTGLGLPHPLENGFAFLSPYGLPYLPGSSVKGVLRRAAEELSLFESDSGGWTLGAVWWLFGFDDRSSYFLPSTAPASVEPLTVEAAILAEQQRWAQAYERVCKQADPLRDAILKRVLHEEVEKDGVERVLVQLARNAKLRAKVHSAGALDFWDVLPEPADGRMRVEIMNPHQHEYLRGTGVPGTWENPIPIFFLTLPSRTSLDFNVVYRSSAPACPVPWRDLISRAFDFGADWLGFGAKTAVGYGRVGSRSALEDDVRERRGEMAVDEGQSVGSAISGKPSRTGSATDLVPTQSRVMVRALEQKTKKGGWRFEVIGGSETIGVWTSRSSPPPDLKVGDVLEVTVVAGGPTPQFDLPTTPTTPKQTSSSRTRRP